MQHINKEALDELVEIEFDNPVVTIYAPMHVTSAPPQISENQIRLKNLISEAVDQLKIFDDSNPLVVELEQLQGDLQANLEFWKNQTPGLLICAAPGDIRMYHLPVDTEEYVAVDGQFHLAWVMGLVNDSHDYYVLTVAQQGPQLLKGDVYGMSPTELGLPETIEAAFGLDEANSRTENQGSASGNSLNPNGFNGRGGARNPEEEDRMRFFRLIDDMVVKFISDNQPLILTGIEAELAEYKSISRYKNILDSTINGNFSDANPQELFEKALAIVQRDIVEPSHRAALEEFEQTQGVHPEKTAVGIEPITTAADQGRVDKLLVGMISDTTDTIRDNFESVTRLTFPDTKLARQINAAAKSVWCKSGQVMGLLVDKLPANSTAVATLRY